MALMLNRQFCDLVKAGIVDPTKVVRTALIDAVSVAALLTTTEAMITDKPEEKSALQCLIWVVWAAWAVACQA